jgi:hypothetical protein
LDGALGEGAGVEGSFYGGWGGGREDLGRDGGVPDVVEGESGSVGEGVPVVEDGAQVARRYAGLEDQGFVGFGDAYSVVKDGQDAVATVLEGRGDEDVRGAGVAGVAQELDESVFDVGQARGAAAGAFEARQAGEAPAEVAVRSLYRATSLTRLSRITVTLIWPGYSRSLSICLEISKASLAATRSSTSEGWTITRISRPAWIA